MSRFDDTDYGDGINRAVPIRLALNRLRPLKPCIDMCGVNFHKIAF